MNKLQILGREGHKELVWEPEQVNAQDPEALAAIAEAEQILEDALARGHAAFRVDAPDEPAIRYGVEGLRRSTVDVPEMYYNLAEAFRLRGDWERAIYCYRRYHNANPTTESARKIQYCQQMATRQQRGAIPEQSTTQAPPETQHEENADTNNLLDQ